MIPIIADEITGTTPPPKENDKVFLFIYFN